MNEEKDEIEFSYEVFDRQLDNFCRMLSILVDAWEDYSPQELTFDIRSLCTKATGSAIWQRKIWCCSTTT